MSSGWEDLAPVLAGLPAEQRERFSRYAGLDLPDEPEGVAAVLRGYAATNPADTPSGMLATTGAQAGFARDLDFAKELGTVALELAQTPEELQLAHVSLAQTHFQNRREPEDLEGFVRHCRAAIEAGHAGTFCYERLLTLYEYRGEREEALRVCRRAVEVLGASDPRSAERFQKRLARLSRG
ncbi:MAG: hypothetical protein H0V53_10640 [Rubrobacter sp.]|nr:hypothetical protein [Rubrobacter sp.]